MMRDALFWHHPCRSRRLLAATAALAQVQQEQPRSALKGHNSNAPVDVTADRIEVQDRANRAIFSGNVTSTQGDMTLIRRGSPSPIRGGQGSAAACRSSGSRPLAASSCTARRRPRSGDFGIYDLTAS